jgi:hypothetical protein
MEKSLSVIEEFDVVASMPLPALTKFPINKSIKPLVS